MKITTEQIKNKLEEVMDPELHMSIVDLGLVYDIQLKDEDKVKITMTLTTLGCPLYSVIETEMKNKLETLGLVAENVDIELTFEPPWSMERMTERAKAMLGI